MSKHSKAPWRVGDYILWPGGLAEGRVPIHAPKRGRIAEVYRVADASLIAAAPELLQALRDCKEFLRIHCGNTDDIANVVMDNARAAIAKATGSAQ